MIYPYAFRGPDGREIHFESPEKLTFNQARQRAFEQWQSMPPVPAPEASAEDAGFFRDISDFLASFGQGALGATEAGASVFGAGTQVTEAIGDVEARARDLLSAEARQDLQRAEEIRAEAEDLGAWEQVKAAARALATAPSLYAGQALGSIAAPVLATVGLAGLGLSPGPALLAAGAVLGVGGTKNIIYDATKESLAETGMPPAEVERRAQEAQAYLGDNLDLIAAGGAVEAIASRLGIDNPIVSRIINRAADKAVDAAAKQGVRQSAEAAAMPLAQRTGLMALAEGAPEAGVGAQQQLAENIALQREGLEVPTERGVVGAAALEGMLGAGVGGVFGAVGPDPVAAEQARRRQREIDDAEIAASEEARLAREAARTEREAEAEAEGINPADWFATDTPETRISKIDAELNAVKSAPEYQEQFNPKERQQITASLVQARKQAQQEIKQVAAVRKRMAASIKGVTNPDQQRQLRASVVDAAPLSAPVKTRLLSEIESDYESARAGISALGASAPTAEPEPEPEPEAFTPPLPETWFANQPIGQRLGLIESELDAVDTAPEYQEQFTPAQRKQLKSSLRQAAKRAKDQMAARGARERALAPESAFGAAETDLFGAVPTEVRRPSTMAAETAAQREALAPQDARLRRTRPTLQEPVVDQTDTSPAGLLRRYADAEMREDTTAIADLEVEGLRQFGPQQWNTMKAMDMPQAREDLIARQRAAGMGQATATERSETFGGPQRALEMGMRPQPARLTERSLIAAGVPVTKPKRGEQPTIRSQYRPLVDALVDKDLTDPRQRAGVEYALQQFDQRYTGAWWGNVRDRIDAQLRATEPAVREMEIEQEVADVARQRRAEQDVDPFAQAEGWTAENIDQHPWMQGARVGALRALSQQTGWAETGGRLIRNEQGEATGRTQWLPRADWWPNKPRGVTEASVASAVSKVEAGKPLRQFSARERQSLAFLAEVDAEQSRGLGDFDLFDVEAPDADLFDVEAPDADLDAREARIRADALRVMDADEFADLQERAALRTEDAPREYYVDALEQEVSRETTQEPEAAPTAEIEPEGTGAVERAAKPSAEVDTDTRFSLRADRARQGGEGKALPWSAPQQNVTSAATSINENLLPGTFTNKAFLSAVADAISRNGNSVRIADIGGGKFDNAVNLFERREMPPVPEKNQTSYRKIISTLGDAEVQFLVHDPFNRTAQHNARVRQQLEGGQADIVTSNNVANVIDAYNARRGLYATMADALKPDGVAFLKLYAGTTDIGVLTKTRDKITGEVTESWQNKAPAKNYIPEVEEFFESVKVAGDILILRGPKASKGSYTPVERAWVVDTGTTKNGAPVLKNYSGSKLERGGRKGDEIYPVGKWIGGQLYLHKDYLSTLPERAQALYREALAQLPAGFTFNTLMWEPSPPKGKPPRIRFDEAPDFDTAREPIPGRQFSYAEDGSTSETSSNQIWHHKWQWVDNDYAGFDVQASIDWSKEYLGVLEGVPNGKREVWEQQLRDAGLRQVDGEADTRLRDQDAVDADLTPISEVELRNTLNVIAPNLVRGPVTQVGPRLTSLGRITLADTFASLPTAIQKNAAKQGSDGTDVGAVFHEGQLFVVKDRMFSAATVEEAVFHEATHKGFRDNIFDLYEDRNIIRASNRLFNAMGGVRGFNRIAQTLGVNDHLRVYREGVMAREEDGTPRYTKQQRTAILVDELVALTGENQKPSIRQRALELLGAVRAWLRDKGYVALANMNAADIANLARRSRERGLELRSGKGRGTRLIRASQSRAQGQPAAGNTGAFDNTDPDIRFSRGSRGSTAQNVRQKVEASGGRIFQPDPPKKLRQKALDAAKGITYKTNAQGQRVKMTSKDHVDRGTKFADYVATKLVSKNAALNAAMRRNLNTISRNEHHNMGVLLNVSDSQPLHRQHMANIFLEFGRLVFDATAKKWRGTRTNANYPEMVKLLERLGAKYDLTFQEVESAAHSYLVAARNQELLRQEAQTQQQIARLRAKGTATAKKQADKLEKKFTGRVYATQAEIDAGLSLRNDIPELSQVADMWTEIRNNAVDVMVQSGMLSKDTAEDYMDRAAYVPFYREGQIESGAGPRDYISTLVTAGLNKPLKGSEKPVNNVFENMVRWTAFNIEAALGNDAAKRMIDTMESVGMATKVPVIPVNQKAKGIEIYQDGKKQAYLVEDPLWLDAFAGLDSLGPVATNIFVKGMSGASELLRKTVTLNPIFSVAQVAQDAFGAMMTSGLPVNQALRIPVETLKEFVKTLQGTSASHEALRRYGATGELAYNANYARDDFETRIQQLTPKTRNWLSSSMESLEFMSMASDNAVRQAVYNLSLAQGDSRGVAIERAFEIINFRRQGSHPVIAMLARVIPFMNAYAQSLNVNAKVLSGTGIAPGKSRQENLKTLMSNFVAFGTLSLLYAMMVGGDEEYEEMDSRVRDRAFYIPGWGATIPLRNDIMLLPKIIAEHTYRLATDAAAEDPQVFKASISDALKNTVMGPTPLPQLFKPALEWATNTSFWTGRPIVGPRLAAREPSEQYDIYTSEFSKMLGENLDVSPKQLDNFIQGTFGSAGGLLMWMSNSIGVIRGVRPTQDFDAIVGGLPGMGRFITKEHGSGLRSMFYELSRETSKVYATYLSMLATDPDKADAYIAEGSNLSKVLMNKSVQALQNELGKIRNQIEFIMQDRTADQKVRQQMIDDLRDYEQQILSYADVKGLRALARQ